MLQLTYLFVQKLNNKYLTDGDYALVCVEFFFWGVIFAILRNT